MATNEEILKEWAVRDSEDCVFNKNCNRYYNPCRKCLIELVQLAREAERKEISLCSCGKTYCAKCLQYSNKRIKELKELVSKRKNPYLKRIKELEEKSVRDSQDQQVEQLCKLVLTELLEIEEALKEAEKHESNKLCP